MKGIIVGSIVAGVGTLLAETADTITSVPGIGALGQLTATGAMIYLVIWLTTKTFPAMLQKSNEAQAATAKALMDAQQAANVMATSLTKDFREEAAEVRGERQKERDFCHGETEALRDRVVHEVSNLITDFKAERELSKLNRKSPPE